MHSDAIHKVINRQKVFSSNAYYYMHNNAYLGDVLLGVYTASQAEMSKNSLTRNEIMMYIKLPGDVLNISETKSGYTDIIRSKFNNIESIPLRVASECILGIFGDSHCDCEKERIAHLEEITKIGYGIYINLPQEGKGRGLRYKVSEVNIQCNGIDNRGNYIGNKTAAGAAQHILGKPYIEKRTYGIVYRVLKSAGLGGHNFELYTSNPKKISELSSTLNISTIKPITAGLINKDNLSDIMQKIYSGNFKYSDDVLIEVIELLNGNNSLPPRVINQIAEIRTAMTNGVRFNVNNKLLKIITSNS